MPTLNHRIHITTPQSTYQALEHIATRDKKQMATKALELLEIALEIEEDEVLDAIAKKRDSKKGAKLISHKEIWG